MGRKSSTSGWKKTWLYPNKRATELYFTFCVYGVTMFKTQQLEPYKRLKNNICSFRKVHKHTLIQNELVSTFTFKKISNYISFINHFYRNNEKKSNKRNTLGWMFVFKGPYLWCKNSLCGWYSQFVNLTLWFALFRCHVIYLNYQRCWWVIYIIVCYKVMVPLPEC